jgi:hypothetical protein
MTEFQGFSKIARLRRDCVVTCKIDGTNACVVVPEDPAAPVLAQSRTRFITPANDNYGFAAWVRNHAEELRQLGPGRHFGEWYGYGINRNYGLSVRRFALFNTSRWNERLWLHFEQERKERERDKYVPNEFFKPPPCCSVVPVLYFGRFDTRAIDTVLAELSVRGSSAVPGFTRPEGIVIYHIRANALFKQTIGNDGEKGTE